MYYIVDSSGRTAGPYPDSWIRQNAQPGTLVSHQGKWIAYGNHPDFRSPAGCPKCGVPPSEGQRFCHACGNALPEPNHPNTPSPHLALINLILPGVAQVAFEQTAKGILIFVLCVVLIPTGVGTVAVYFAAIVDAYMVGRALRRTGSVDRWAFFPS